MHQHYLSVLLLGILVSTAQAQAPGKTAVDLLGDPLPDGAVARLGTLRFKHDPAGGQVIETLAFSPDGTIIASQKGNGVGSIRLWDAATGRHLPGPWCDGDELYSAFAFSPDGSILAAATGAGRGLQDRDIVLWNIATAKQIKTLCGTTDLVQALAFADEGKTLVAAGSDAVRWWSVALGKEQRSWRLLENDKQPAKGSDMPARAFLNCTLSPDGKFLAVAVGTKIRNEHFFEGKVTPSAHLDASSPVEVAGYDLATRSMTWRTSGKPEESGIEMRFAFSADGKRLVFANNPDKVILRDSLTGKLVTSTVVPPKITEPTGIEPTRLAVLEAGIRYFRSRLRLWDPDFMPTISNGKLALSPNGTMVASIAGNGQVALWNQNDPDAVRWLPQSKAAWPGTAASAVAFSPDGKKVAVAAGSGLAVFDVATLTETIYFEGHHRAVDFLTFSADSKRLVTACSEQVVGLNNPLTWNTSTWKAVPAPKVLSANLPPGGICSPDQTTYAVRNNDERYSLHSLATGKLVAVLTVPKHTRPSEDGEARNFVVRFNQGTKATAFFSPDAKYFVLAGPDASGKAAQLLYATSTGKLLGTMPPQGRAVELLRPLAFSGDGRLVATFNPADGLIHVFDILASKLTYRLGNPPPEEDRSNDAVQLAFNNDGKLLASWSAADGVVRIWEMATGKQKMVLPSDGEEHQRLLLAWSADGRTLAVADRKLQFWEIATLKVRHELAGKINALDFSPDGRFLATASEDTTVLVWDLWKR